MAAQAGAAEHELAHAVGLGVDQDARDLAEALAGGDAPDGRALADGAGGWLVHEGLSHDEFAKDRIRITTEELESERAEVRQLGLIG